MPIQSAPYYFAVCDDCGNAPISDEFTAWDAAAARGGDGGHSRRLRRTATAAGAARNARRSTLRPRTAEVTA